MLRGTTVFLAASDRQVLGLLAKAFAGQHAAVIVADDMVSAWSSLCNHQIDIAVLAEDLNGEPTSRIQDALNREGAICVSMKLRLTSRFTHGTRKSLVQRLAAETVSAYLSRQTKH